MSTRPSSVVKFAVEGNRWIITECYHDLSAFIRSGLEFAMDESRKLRSFGRREENAGRAWREIVEAFCAAEGIEAGFWVNTFEGANLLMPNAIYFQAGDLIFLQAHTGNDARSGYEKPRAYRDPSDWLYRNAKAVLSPEPKNKNGVELFLQSSTSLPVWTTDDAGERWHAQGGEFKDLTAYEASVHPVDRGNGKMFVDRNGTGFCPVTGRALRLGFFHGNSNEIPCWR